jgi:hypothetical protein
MIEFSDILSSPFKHQLTDQLGEICPAKLRVLPNAPFALAPSAKHPHKLKAIISIAYG